MWSTVLETNQASIHRIELPGPWPGCTTFLSPWLITLVENSTQTNILVDPGPACSIRHLIQILDKFEIKTLDWILLTHVHIDHAGGVGLLLSEAYPSAKVVVHNRGYKHLVNPETLWQASLSTLGRLADVYGKIHPVPQNNLVNASTINEPIHGIHILDTPGHASHHLSYLLPLENQVGNQKVLFTGEAAGIFCNFPDLNTFYMRPATPPKFFFETSMRSLDLLASTGPTIVCCGHYGFSGKGEIILESHKEQLKRWKRIIDTHRQSEISTILNHLFDKDHLLHCYARFDDALKQREKYFLTNSVKGFLG